MTVESKRERKMQVKCQVCDFHFVLYTRRAKYNKKRRSWELANVMSFSSYFILFFFQHLIVVCAVSAIKIVWHK